MQNNVTQIQAKNELWSRGLLSWKCHQVQKEMYDIFYASKPHTTLVWLLGRQSGKSYLLGILALEQALRQPNSIIKLLTDTKLHVKSIFEKIFDELLLDCPEFLKPKYNTSQFTYVFPNGSAIQLAGSDGKHYEKLRGQKASLILVDEAGFCNDLETAVKSVLIPTTTHTGGKIVLASTPPEESEHDFMKFLEEAELNKTLVTKTINDNPLLSPEQRLIMIEKLGGILSPRVRREFFCEIIRDASVTVIPEFTPELEKEIVKDWPTPPFFDCYESMDLGGKDLTVVLFAYYDFRADKVVVQDELVVDFRLPNNTLPKLVEGIIQKEDTLWTNPLTAEVRKPYIRVSDINHIVTQEIYRSSNHRLNFISAKKDDKDSALNTLRVMLSNGKVVINSKCTTLVRHLRNVKWSSDKNKREFGRSADHGHYDAVDALIYLLRHIQFNKNPYPAHYNLNMKDLYVARPENFYKTEPQELYAKIFNWKRKR